MVEIFTPDEDGMALLASLGRVVLAAGGLEAFVLVVTVQLATERGDAAADIAALISRLENAPAGRRLGAFVETGGDPELADEIGAAIKQRNEVIHHLFRDPRTIAAVSAGATADLLNHLDGVALACASALERLLPSAAGFMSVNGVTGDLMSLLGRIDLEDVEDAGDREMLEALKALPADRLREVLDLSDIDAPSLPADERAEPGEAPGS